MATKVKEIIKLLEEDGWYFKRQNGSHQIYRHPIKTGIAVVPNHGMNKELKEGTVQSILKQAGLKD